MDEVGEAVEIPTDIGRKQRVGIAERVGMNVGCVGLLYLTLDRILKRTLLEKSKSKT
jgi:hypothetical protein